MAAIHIMNPHQHANIAQQLFRLCHFERHDSYINAWMKVERPADHQRQRFVFMPDKVESCLYAGENTVVM